MTNPIQRPGTPQVDLADDLEAQNGVRVLPVGALEIEEPAREEPITIRQLVGDVAKRAIAEFAFSLSVAAVCTPFATVPGGVGYVWGALAVQTTANLFTRMTVAYFDRDAFQVPNEPEDRITGCLHWFPATGFAVATGISLGSLIHESFHAVMGAILLKGSHIRIELGPWRGATYFGAEEFSKVGEQLGKARSVAAISAAGPFGVTTVASFALLGGLAMKTNLEARRMILASSVAIIAKEALYALLSLGEDQKNSMEDFTVLRRKGLHQVAAATIVVAIPLLALAARKCVQVARERGCFAALRNRCVCWRR